VWGQVLLELVRNLPDTLKPSQALCDKIRVLDTFYIGPRYPNSHVSGAPFEYYGPIQSEQAITYAREILEFVHSQMA
jgi:HEPN domain-containing protein